jgi:methyl-accepting chemotaxis protein
MKFRRRKFLINAGLQMKITMLFIIVSLVGSIAATVAFNYYAMKDLEAVMWSTHISVKDTGEIIRPLFLYVNIIDFLFVFIMLVIAVVWMMKKTTGPLFRMSKDITKVADGDLSVVLALRQKDEFQDTAYELDNMITGMRDRFRAIKEKYYSVSGSLKGLKSTDASGKACEAVLRDIDNLKEEIKNFEID